MKKAMSLLVLSAAALAAAFVVAAEPATARADWPLWDGKESVADYAKRAGIKDVPMELDLGSGVSMKLTLIPAAKFIMGDLDEKRETIEGIEVAIQQAGKGPYWSRPDREVTISQPFYMGAYEVTQEQYEQIMGPDPGREGRYDEKKGYTRGKTYPEGLLSWKEAAEFCEKLSVKTGMKVWLPTEAQWEYAARGGAGRIVPGAMTPPNGENTPTAPC